MHLKPNVRRYLWVHFVLKIAKIIFFGHRYESHVVASVHPAVTSVNLSGAVLNDLGAPEAHVVKHSTDTIEILLIFTPGGMKVVLEELPNKTHVVLGLLFGGLHRVNDLKSVRFHVDIHQKPVVALNIDRNQHIPHLK